mgnify:CR=1 FL=1
MLVETNKGLIERNDLTVKDVIYDEDNARVVATEWFFNNELVRRDVNVNILRGLDLAGDAGCRACANGKQRHHRRYTDDDTENGQHRAHFICLQGAQGDL